MPSMMLPTFSAESLPGLVAYPAPPVLDNSNNRGQIRASRSERISYVVQAEGVSGVATEGMLMKTEPVTVTTGPESEFELQLGQMLRFRMLPGAEIAHGERWIVGAHRARPNPRAVARRDHGLRVRVDGAGARGEPAREEGLE